MTSKVTITKDRVEEVLAAVMEADKYEVLVGVPEETADRSGGAMNNAQLAYIHNYGSPAANIPARPFLEPGIDDVQDTIVALAETAIQVALEATGKSAARSFAESLSRIGQFAANSVVAKLTQGPHVPLKPATIRRKKSSQPLIDTGQLRQSITWVLREKE